MCEVRDERRMALCCASSTLFYFILFYYILFYFILFYFILFYLILSPLPPRSKRSGKSHEVLYLKVKYFTLCAGTCLLSNYFTLLYITLHYFMNVFEMSGKSEYTLVLRTLRNAMK